MGPTIMLDKSALQSLSSGEMDVLRRYYIINIPPVLLIEILADLKKEDTDDESITEVKRLASKIILLSTYTNVHYSQLLLNELLGASIIMDGRVILGAETKEVRDESGNRGYVIDASKESRTISLWSSGKFTEAEELLASDWRRSTQELDLERFKRDVKENAPLIAEIGDIEAAKNLILSFLDMPEYQPLILSWLLEDIYCDENIKNKIRRRFENGQVTSLKRMVPYSYFYLAVTFTFYSALTHNIIGTRRTNVIDMQYVYYVPFTNIFSSGDKFHNEFAPVFFREDQEFILSTDLKADLRSLCDFWNSLTKDESAAWDRYYGSYPPRKKGSFTTDMWGKYMAPWQRGWGNQAVEISEDDAKRIIDEMKGKIEAYENEL